ncbi:flagellar protein FlgN [Luteimonas sp. A478]
MEASRVSVEKTSVEKLAAALAGEREALVAGDAEALLRNTQDKLAALRELEAGIGSDPAELAPRLAELAELNRANGVLLARRRREVNWALRCLGRAESAPAYDATGAVGHSRPSRGLAVV